MLSRKFTFALLAGTAMSVAGAAYAADVYTPPPEPAYAPAAEAFSWTGIYFGVNGGYAWGNADASFRYGFLGATDLNPQGPFVGGTLGFNWQMGSIVLGVEGDYDWANLTDSHSGPGAYGGYITNEMQIDQLATARLRLGWAAGQFMPFITGGFAFGHAERTNNFNYTGITRDDNWHTGWTVGAGLEYAVNNHVSLKGEYRYVDLGTANYDVFAPPGGVDVDLTVQQVLVGVNLRW